MTPTVLVPLCDGIEEIEAVCIIDVLRRAHLAVTAAGLDSLQLKASRGTGLVADRLLAECLVRDWDAVVLPGGLPGAERLRDSADLAHLLRRQLAAGRLVGAICASPAVVLAAHGLLDGRRATCHPSFLDRLPETVRRHERVVVDGPLVTSQGPGTALEFALKLVELLAGRDRARAVAAPLVLPGGVGI